MICSVDGCGDPATGRGWCAAHYGRWYRHGDPLVQLRPGRGTGRSFSGGYVLIHCPDHPLADAKGRVAEHRKVWHDANGPIPDRHHVHHLNGDRADNRLENLEVIDPNEHGRMHSAEGHAVRYGYESAVNA